MAQEGGGLAGGQFGHRGLFSVRFFVVLKPGGPPGQQTGRLQLQGHVSQLVLDGLQLGEGFAEGGTFGGVFGRHLKRRLGYAQCLAGYSDPSSIQGLHGDLSDTRSIYM